jgi:site-specific DNA recombinase
VTLCSIYARYSTDLQSEASIEHQVRLCRERAGREGWGIYEIYADAAVSGASLIRPGIQQLMADAGKFQIVLTESLDRLSRDQEDVAGLYKRLKFVDTKIITLSEGEISELHIGLTGTMSALYLKNLADKTRRGQRGRVEAGKIGGGNSYGYDVVKRFADNGDLIRGDRAINPAQAAIVTRICSEYAEGFSPRSIAARLNREGIPGPAGAAWGASTIHGHRQRGTGIINNELYVGRIVWNRLRYVKDPSSGRRVSRLNPESQWIYKDVPHLRIIPDELWQAVKDKQGIFKASTAHTLWDKRRPKTLFSGLIKCGRCGARMVLVCADRFGCAAARNKGTCSNRLTIKVDPLEQTILDGLQHHLMDPALLEVFAAEYVRHMNALKMERSSQSARDRAELARLTRELDRLVQAIMDGFSVAQAKDKAKALERRKEELAARLHDTTDDPIVIHPSMSQRYRQQISALRQALNEGRAEASAILRGLVERIDVTPDGNIPAIDLHGDLAGMLSLSAGLQNSISLVAGVGFEPTTFRL